MRNVCLIERMMNIQLNLEDLFQKALNSPQHLSRIQAVLDKMSKHPDFTTRVLLMRKLPRLALLCAGENQSEHVNTRLWPLILSCLNDKNEEVRKSCEVSLLVFIKEKLLDQEVITEKVCPSIVKICKEDGFASTVAVSIIRIR
ncbi:hypothetical protein Phum_PHUM581520 [Pediculus humanus corporis]|uniref:Uncharacterized protein n=1 Tax=Pediculus humanus subsp. corporis TaxID=121224 RepID=E0W1P1_PEDHC|nr:uncharacterized protein Phum_PHUM581520 [Pediculus humanus corporis]EEB19623.1 hypothetical protein Phum_PHUM581520 [Pediculus humanus corporis]